MVKIHVALLGSSALSLAFGSTCVWDTSQCGGKNWKGLTKCCNSKSVCTKINDYYSKCVAGAAPTPTSSSCSNKTDSQCGGKDFHGNTCCPSGLKCTYRNEWFSKCMASSVPAPTPSSSCSNKTDSQCGGLNFHGNTCCPSGLKCTYRNEWFSKCMASTAPTPTTTSKPTTGTSCTNKLDSQCGGSSFHGNTCCPSGLKCTYRNEWFSKCMSASTTPTPTSVTTSKPSSGGSTSGSCPSGSVSAIYKGYNIGGDPYGNDQGACNRDVTVCCPASCGTCDTSTTCLTSGKNPSCCAATAVKQGCLSHAAPCLVPQADDLCKTKKCLNGGECKSLYSPQILDDGTKKCNPVARCFCKAPYIGDVCQSPCPSGEAPCGSASGYTGSLPIPNQICCNVEQVCVSVDEKYGSDTQCVPKDHPTSCTPNPCKNGAYCGQPGYGSTTNVCTCQPGWGGGLCDQVFKCVREEETECGAVKLDQNGGYNGNTGCCTSSQNCIKYFSPSGTEYFTWCASKSLPKTCNPNPCKNGGICQYLKENLGYGTYTSNVLGCYCPDHNYYGDFCESKYS